MALAIGAELAPSQPELHDRAFAARVAVDRDGDVLAIADVRSRIFCGRIDEERRLVGDGVAVRLRSSRRIDQREVAPLVPPIASLAGEQEVGPLVREPVVARTPRLIRVVLPHLAFRAEMLDVTVADMQRLGLAEGTLLVLHLDEVALDALVSIDVSVELELPGFRRVRGEICVDVRLVLLPTSEAFREQHRGGAGASVDPDHALSLRACAARRITSIASMSSGVSPWGRSPIAARSSASRRSSSSDSTGLARISSRSRIASSSSGARALGMSNSSLVRI